MAVEVIVSVSQSSDDARRRLSDDTWTLASVSFESGAHSTVWQFGSGGRFQNVAIPHGALIVSATLTLKCRASTAGVTCNTRISAEDVDDAPTFADDKDVFDTRWANRTTARVDWDGIAAWTLNEFYTSVDFASVIQEIIDRPGWVSGQSVVIFWDDFEDRSTHAVNAYRSAFSYDGQAANSPKLTVNYIAPSNAVWDYFTWS